jgi:hypothetical protein
VFLHGFFPLSNLALFLLPQFSVLWRADEHLDEVIVQGIVELALKAPLELRVIQIAGVKIEVVGVDGNAFVLKLDDDFNSLAFGSRGEVQKGMLVEAKLGEHAVEARTGFGGHKGIVPTGMSLR